MGGSIYREKQTICMSDFSTFLGGAIVISSTSYYAQRVHRSERDVYRGGEEPRRQSRSSLAVSAPRSNRFGTTLTSETLRTQ